MKKVSLFGIIAFTLLSFNAIWSLFSSIKRYNEFRSAGGTDIGIMETFQTFVLPLFSAVAMVMLLIFFIGLYRKQK